jgi:hypothetical protein
MEDQCLGTLNRGSAPRLPGGAAALIRSSNPVPASLINDVHHQLHTFSPMPVPVKGIGTGWRSFDRARRRIAGVLETALYIPMIIKCASLLAVIATR